MTGPLLLRTEEGKRRCQSTAPVHGDQCEKKRKHNKKEDRVTHKAGSLVWADNTTYVRKPEPVDLSGYVTKVEVPGLPGLKGPFQVRVGPGEDVAQRVRRVAKEHGVELHPWQADFAAKAFGAEVHLAKGNEATTVEVDETTGYAPDAQERIAGLAPDGLPKTAPRVSEDEVPTWHLYGTPEKAPPEDVTPEEALRDWWFAQASTEVDRTVPKAIEYGATDLIDIGLMLGRTMRREVNAEEAAELGVFFYLIGKVARWQSAIERGERPSDDTLFDVGVYVRMAQRIRSHGGWPGTEEL